MSVGRFRFILNRTLDDTCRIEKLISGGVVYGQVANDWATVAQSVRCRLIRAGNARGGAAGLVGERSDLREEYRLILPVGTEIGADYRVTVGEVAYRVTRVGTALSAAVSVEAVVVREDDNG